MTGIPKHHDSQTRASTETPARRKSMNPIVSIRNAYRQHGFKRAVSRAYQAFVRQVPHGEDFLFDQHFLSHQGLSVLHAYWQKHAPNPVALAQACANQWGFQGEKHAAFVETLTPVAARFLRLLEHELRQTGTVSGGLELHSSY